jgi:hypothetical protein
MKKLLLILLCLPMIGFGQTLIPDANFEQALINFGYDTGTPNGSVPTASIDTVTSLDVNNMNISDLTGIEDFTALTYLNCGLNSLTSLDVSANTALTYLECGSNQLTSLDVSNANLTTLYCLYNQLTSLDVSQNTILTYLNCGSNQLTSLDVSSNTSLTGLNCYNNQLISLNVRNGNNQAMEFIKFFNVLEPGINTITNPDLKCISVDDASWSTGYWMYLDPQHYFSNNCSGTAIQEHTTNKQLLKVTDLLGRETKGKKNQPLFYIYDDGTVEKRIVIE